MATENVSIIPRRMFLKKVPLTLATAAGGLAILAPTLMAQHPDICGPDCDPDPPPRLVPPNFWQEDSTSISESTAFGNIFQRALDNGWTDLDDYPGAISHLQACMTEWANLGNIFQMDGWIVDNETTLVGTHRELDPVQIQIWCQNGTWWTIYVLVNGLQKKVSGVFDCKIDGELVKAAAVLALTFSMFPATRNASAALGKAAAWFKVVSQAAGCP